MKEKTILITGTSSGFGKLAVPQLLQRGHTVIAGLRGGEQRLKEIFAHESGASGASGVSGVLERFPGKLFAIDLHVESDESLAAARDFVAARFNGRLDVLVNNAGYGLFGALEDQTPEQLRRQFEVNVFGPLLLTRLLLPALRAAHGRVINVSSICGLVTFPLYGAYCATKHALEAFSESMRYDLMREGVQVALLEPGGHRTDFTGRSRAWGETSFDAESPSRARCEALQKTFTNSNIRMGDPMRVVRKLVRLCEKEKIPMRTLVGPDARFMALVRKILPENMRVAVEDWMFRVAVFRGA